MKIHASMQKFCDECSIHGVQYLAPSKQILERCLWGVVIVLFSTLSVLVVSSLFQNWEEQPIITTIDTMAYPVQKIPFPAVTVCPNGFDQWAFLVRFVYCTLAPPPAANCVHSRRKRCGGPTFRHRNYVLPKSSFQVGH